MELKLYKEIPQELKSEWNALLDESIMHVPFVRFEYLQTWWETRGGGEWPQDAQPIIIAGRENGRLIGIAPFFLAQWEGKPTLLLLGSIEISDYLDLIVRPGDLEAFTSALLDFLAQPDSGLPVFDRLDLYNVLETSPSLPALQSAAGKIGWSYQVEPFRPAMTIPLTGDWETYLAGIDKKQRHEIRRKMRRAQSAELPVHWYIVEDPAQLEHSIDEFLRLMSSEPDKATFLTPAMRENFRQTMRCAFEAHCLLLAFLKINGENVATYYIFDYLDQLWVYNSGMNYNYNEYSPGWVLLGNLLEWANQNGRKTFDFMRGDEDYKIRFGAQKRDVMHVTIAKD